MATLTRFEFPDIFRSWLNIPISMGAVDAADLITLGGEFGGDWRGIGDAIIESSFANIHTDQCKAGYTVICKSWDMVLNTENVL